jgi:hypothetical protein
MMHASFMIDGGHVVVVVCMKSVIGLLDTFSISNMTLYLIIVRGVAPLCPPHVVNNLYIYIIYYYNYYGTRNAGGGMEAGARGRGICTTAR